MTTPRPDLAVSRLELLILARLTSPKSPSDKELTDVVRNLALPTKDARADQIAAHTLSELRRRGLVHEPTKQARNRRTLTDTGVRALRTGLDLDKAPVWKDIHPNHLLARALGLKPGSAAAVQATKDANNIANLIVRNHHKVSKPSDVADKLLAEALGLPPGPVTIARLRAHMLSKHAGMTTELTSKKVLIKLAEKAIGQTCHDKKTMSRALIWRWVYETMSAQAVAGPRAVPSQPTLVFPPAPAPASNGHSRPTVAVVSGHPSKPTPANPPAKDSLSSSKIPTIRAPDVLLNLVHEAIPRIGADGRFGPEKVFVSALWHRIERDNRLTDVSFDHFKSWLVTANRNQQIDLARADVVGAMDPKLVAESEIQDLGATFHFVVDRRVNGARGPHAR
jgi:hypothetical protein